MILRKILMVVGLLVLPTFIGFAQNASAVDRVHIKSSAKPGAKPEVCVNIYKNTSPTPADTKCTTIVDHHHGKIFNNPPICPIKQECRQDSSPFVYMWCKHTGGGTPIDHMDIYFAAPVGTPLGRLDFADGSRPNGCDNSFLLGTTQRSQSATGQGGQFLRSEDRPVQCTGTCNFNYYPKP